MLLVLYILAIFVHTVTGIHVPGVPPELTQDDDVISAISNQVANTFLQEYWIFMESGYESSTLKKLTTELAKSHSFKDVFTKRVSDWNRSDQFFMCTTCRATINVISRMFRSEDGEFNGPDAENNSKVVFMEMCRRFKLTTLEVCSGLFDLNWPALHYIIMKTNADSRSICGSLPISFCTVKQEEFDWHIHVDNTTGLLTAAKSQIPQKTPMDLNILHLTDIHYDPEYKPGSLADCPEPLCCRYLPTGPILASQKAGFWGDYRECDPPLYMIDNAFDEIKRVHRKIDYIYYTGDTIPHNVWSTTREGNQKIISEMHELMTDKFKGVQIYPSIGNHEAHPTNLFGIGDISDELSIKWLYEYLWALWSPWLPEAAKETFLKGGYYTAIPRKGLRIISLSNNDCYILNWWLFYNGRNISMEQLQWLHDTLLEAEQVGENVHILAHVPTGSSDCWTVWAREFNRIIERFSSVVSGIFNGHTHTDEMIVHYSENGHAMGISWNAGSLTPYSNKNPNYRIYEVEPLTYQVVDHETWIFNLTEANERGDKQKPNWFKEYQFSEFTTNLSPEGIDMWLDDMAANPNILYQYWEYKVTSADPKLLKGCNQECLLKTICSIAVSSNNRRERCQELRDKLNKQLTEDGYASTTILPRTSTISVEDANNANSNHGPTILTLFIFYTLSRFV